MTCQSLISDLSDVESLAFGRWRQLGCISSPSFFARWPWEAGGARRRTLCVRGTLKKWVLYVTFFE